MRHSLTLRPSDSVLKDDENGMTRLANPTCDSVCKYLLEDNRVTCLVLATLLEGTIIELTFRPPEFLLQGVRVSYERFRMDFAALLALADGTGSWCSLRSRRPNCLRILFESGSLSRRGTLLVGISTRFFAKAMEVLIGAGLSQAAAGNGSCENRWFSLRCPFCDRELQRQKYARSSGLNSSLINFA